MQNTLYIPVHLLKLIKMRGKYLYASAHSSKVRSKNGRLCPILLTVNFGSHHFSKLVAAFLNDAW
jgi:hypothetical protein